MSEKNPRIVVDAVVVKDNSVLLIKRKTDPFKDCWALPGGFVEVGETVEQAVVREVKEECGVEVELDSLLGVYSNPDRDPRGHVVSVVFVGIPKSGKLKESSESEPSWKKFEEAESLKLAFDHQTIIEDFRIIMMIPDKSGEKV